MYKKGHMNDITEEIYPVSKTLIVFVSVVNTELIKMDKKDTYPSMAAVDLK